MPNKDINQLRETLFETMDKLMKNEIEVPKAQAIVNVANAIINSAKVEIDFQKLIDSKERKSQFLLPSDAQKQS